MVVKSNSFDFCMKLSFSLSVKIVKWSLCLSVYKGYGPVIMSFNLAIRDMVLSCLKIFLFFA